METEGYTNIEEQKAQQEEVQEEKRYMVPTKNGVIDQDAVEKFRQAHFQALKANSFGTDETQESNVFAISSNQTQEYFAIATEKGFEIL